jgi:hypothetical protein
MAIGVEGSWPRTQTQRVRKPWTQLTFSVLFSQGSQSMKWYRSHLESVFSHLSLTNLSSKSSLPLTYLEHSSQTRVKTCLQVTLDQVDNQYSLSQAQLLLINLTTNTSLLSRIFLQRDSWPSQNAKCIWFNFKSARSFFSNPRAQFKSVSAESLLGCQQFLTVSSCKTKIKFMFPIDDGMKWASPFQSEEQERIKEQLGKSKPEREKTNPTAPCLISVTLDGVIPIPKVLRYPKPQLYCLQHIQLPSWAGLLLTFNFP